MNSWIVVFLILLPFSHSVSVFNLTLVYHSLLVFGSMKEIFTWIRFIIVTNQRLTLWITLVLFVKLDLTRHAFELLDFIKPLKFLFVIGELIFVQISSYSILSRGLKQLVYVHKRQIFLLQLLTGKSYMGSFSWELPIECPHQGFEHFQEWNSAYKFSSLYFLLIMLSLWSHHFCK